MKNSFNSDLSLVLLIGLAMKNVPIRFLQPFLQRAMEVIQTKHSSIFVRLANNEVDFLVDAVDLPFMFYLKPDISKPKLLAIKRGEKSYASAVIRGSFVDLLQLFEGKIDGDAAFFSKKLTIEGSTAATVALRNAVDSEDMDVLQDLSEIFTPFDKQFITFTNAILKVYNNIQESIDEVVGFANSGVNNKIKINEMRIDDIIKDIDEIQEILQKINKDQIRKKTDYKE